MEVDSPTSVQESPATPANNNNIQSTAPQLTYPLSAPLNAQFGQGLYGQPLYNQALAHSNNYSEPQLSPSLGSQRPSHYNLPQYQDKDFRSYASDLNHQDRHRHASPVNSSHQYGDSTTRVQETQQIDIYQKAKPSTESTRDQNTRHAPLPQQDRHSYNGHHTAYNTVCHPEEYGDAHDRSATVNVSLDSKQSQYSGHYSLQTSHTPWEHSSAPLRLPRCPEYLEGKDDGRSSQLNDSHNDYGNTRQYHDESSPPPPTPTQTEVFIISLLYVTILYTLYFILDRTYHHIKIIE